MARERLTLKWHASFTDVHCLSNCVLGLSTPLIFGRQNRIHSSKKRNFHIYNAVFRIMWQTHSALERMCTSLLPFSIIIQKHSVTWLQLLSILIEHLSSYGRMNFPVNSIQTEAIFESKFLLIFWILIHVDLTISVVFFSWFFPTHFNRIFSS